jgi:hypothetical protein
MKPAVPAQVIPREEPLEESHRLLFRERISPLWVEEDSNVSLDQPAPVKFVPSVTTYGISEEPISR